MKAIIVTLLFCGILYSEQIDTITKLQNKRPVNLISYILF